MCLELLHISKKKPEGGKRGPYWWWSLSSCIWRLAFCWRWKSLNISFMIEEVILEEVLVQAYFPSLNQRNDKNHFQKRLSAGRTDPKPCGIPQGANRHRYFRSHQGPSWAFQRARSHQGDQGGFQSALLDFGESPHLLSHVFFFFFNRGILEAFKANSWYLWAKKRPTQRRWNLKGLWLVRKDVNNALVAKDPTQFYAELRQAVAWVAIASGRDWWGVTGLGIGGWSL